VDGYTYMIERNKLMIEYGRKRDLAILSTPQSADDASNDHTLMRKRLMDLYVELEGCGRAEHDSQQPDGQ